MATVKLTHRAKVARKCNAYVICAGSGRIEAGEPYLLSYTQITMYRRAPVFECAECVTARDGWNDHYQRVNAPGARIMRCDVYETGGRMGIKSPRTGRVLWVDTARVPGWLRKSIRLSLSWKRGKGGVSSQLYYMIQEDPTLDPRKYTCAPLLPEDLRMWADLASAAEVA